MLEDQEENIEEWYFDKKLREETPLEKYLCEDRVLKSRDASCLRELYQPTDDDQSEIKVKGDQGKNDL